jgi:hypothetical protein
MFYKTNLVYLAEDNNFDYDDFPAYCFGNYPDLVWRVFDGIEYCRSENADFLAKEYSEYLTKKCEYF